MAALPVFPTQTRAWCALARCWMRTRRCKHEVDGTGRGQNGSDGGPGPIGPQGPPFANAVVDNVNTLLPGNPAGVNVSFDGTNVRFTFSIPQGADGATGPQGLPGEVTQTDLNNAVTQMTNDSSASSNTVATLGLSVSDPPTQAQVQQIADKLDELINALRR